MIGINGKDRSPTVSSFKSVQVHEELLTQAVGQRGMPNGLKPAEIVRWCLAYVAGMPDPAKVATVRTGRPNKREKVPIH
jgi:hypothetical protein